MPIDLLPLLESRRWHCAPGDDHDDRDDRDDHDDRDEGGKKVDVDDQINVDYVGGQRVASRTTF